MTAAAPLQAPSDLDAFLDWEMLQEERFELVEGAVRLMEGGTEGHDRAGGNIAAALRVQLRGSPCSAHGPNLRVVSRAARAVMYPDVLVRCGPREDRRTLCEDPVVVVEVLSEATARHDLTRKRLAYEAIPSLRRIVYVAPDEARVDMRVRGEDGLWRDEAVEGLAASLALPEIAARLDLADIFAETEVAEPPPA